MRIPHRSPFATETFALNALQYIDGRWRDGHDRLEVRNPSNTSESVGWYSEADADLVGEAVQAATSALSEWAAVPITEKERILSEIGSALIEERACLGQLIARETGKLIATATGEVERAGQFFRYFAASALRQRGEIHPGMIKNTTVTVTREPVGVVGLVTPWNFPIAIPAWKIAPALAYGNTVVFKPSEFSSLTAWELAKIIDASDLPKGVFNMVTGGGATGRAICDHASVAAVSFTGSRATGQAIANTCSARMAKVQLEMGGKNPLVILKDADLGEAVSASVDGAFGSTGQRCTASSRLIVEKGVLDEFKAAFLERTAQLKVGDALDDTTDIGPVINSRQLEQHLDHVARAIDDGATLLTPDPASGVSPEGHYMRPVALETSDNGFAINRHEVFGPVATLIPAADYEDALRLANETEFGLASGIFTSSLAHAEDFKRRSKAGVVRVNMATPGSDYHVPFGGTKSSSLGTREQGEYAQEFFTTVKTAYTRYF